MPLAQKKENVTPKEEKTVNTTEMPKVVPSFTSVKTTDIDAVAKDVIRGKYGNGDERKKNLAAAGYDPAKVQARVNEIMHGEDKKADDLDAVAKDVIKGKYGNGDERKKNLTAAGYDPAKVQAKVNELLRK